MERKCWSQQEGPPRVETAAAAALSSIRIVLKAFSKIQKDREDSPRTNTSSFAVQLHGYFTRTQFLPQMAHTNTGASTARGFLALVLLPISNVSICPALVSCLCLTWASAQQKHSLSLSKSYWSGIYLWAFCPFWWWKNSTSCHYVWFDLFFHS